MAPRATVNVENAGAPHRGDSRTPCASRHGSAAAGTVTGLSPRPPTKGAHMRRFWLVLTTTAALTASPAVAAAHSRGGDPGDHGGRHSGPGRPVPPPRPMCAGVA